MPLSQYQMATPGVSEFGNTMNRIAIGMAQQKYQMEQQRQMMALKQAELASDMMHQRMQEQLYGAQANTERAQTVHYGAQTSYLGAQEKALAEQLRLKNVAQNQLQLLNRQHGALYSAQADAERAQAGHYDAQTSQIQGQQKAAQGFGDIMGMITQAQANPVPYDMGKLQGLAAQQAGVLAGQGRQHVPVNMAQILQMNNPRAQQMMATGTKMTANVPAGGSLVDVLNQNTMMQSPRTLSRGQTMVPGMGGPAIAEGMPPAAGQSALLKAFASLQALQGQYRSGGDVMNPEDPQYQEINKAVMQLLPFVSQQATNAPQPQINAPQTGAPSTKGPAVGTVSKGYKFKGGNPADKANWEKVQ